MLNPKILKALCPDCPKDDAEYVIDSFPNIERLTLSEIKKIVGLVIENHGEQSPDIEQLLAWIDDLEHENKKLKKQIKSLTEAQKEMVVSEEPKKSNVIQFGTAASHLSHKLFDSKFLSNYDSVLPGRWKSKFIADNIQLSFPWWYYNLSTILSKIDKDGGGDRRSSFMFDVIESLDNDRMLMLDTLCEKYNYTSPYNFQTLLKKQYNLGLETLRFKKSETVLYEPDLVLIRKHLGVEKKCVLPTHITFFMPAQCAKFWNKYAMKLPVLEMLLHLQEYGNLSHLSARLQSIVAQSLDRFNFIESKNYSPKITEFGKCMAAIHLTWLDTAIKQENKFKTAINS